MVTFLSFELL